MNNAKATIISSIITGVFSLIVGFGTGKAVTVTIDNKAINEEYTQKLESENNELQKANSDYLTQIDELKKQIEVLDGQVKKLTDTSNNSESTVESSTTESSDSVYYLSDLEDIGIEGENFYCYFGEFKEFSKDNLGNYHNNGLIFFAKGMETNVLSKSYYNNGKYKTISGTVALSQVTKDTQSTATLRVYGIKDDQSIETIYTSKEFIAGVTPDDIGEKDISAYEIIKVEVTFIDGYSTAIGLYDAYFK